MSGSAALWFVLQKNVVEAGALQQVGLSRLIGLTFSGDLGLSLDSLDKILTELVEPASEDLVSTDKCRCEHDPKSAPKSCGVDEKGKNSKGKGKNGKMVQFGGRHVQKCFRYLRSKCQKGKDCGFTHNKDDPSKGDLEVQRRMAEKKTRESSGRDAVTVLFLEVIV